MTLKQISIKNLIRRKGKAFFVLAGLVIYLTTFNARAFLFFGLAASIPFFVFNYYFYFVAEVFNHWMVLDFVGNIGILVLCAAGYRSCRMDEMANG